MVRYKKLKQKNWQKLEEINRILHYQGLFYILEIYRVKQISKNYDDLPADYFIIRKI